MGSKTGLYTFWRIALALAGGLIWFVNRPKAVAAAAPLSADAKAYVRNLQLTDVTMKATESYVGQTVTEIEGKIAQFRQPHRPACRCVLRLLQFLRRGNPARARSHRGDRR